MDPIDELLGMIQFEEERKNGSKPEGRAKGSDAVMILLEYWQAEVDHLQGQKDRLLRLGHHEARSLLLERLAYAREQLDSLKGGGG